MLQSVYDIQPDGSGRLDWIAVTTSFLADVVEIVGKGMPAVFNEETESKGITRDLFHPGSTVLVAVRRKAPGAKPYSHTLRLYTFSSRELPCRQPEGMYRVP